MAFMGGHFAPVRRRFPAPERRRMGRVVFWMRARAGWIGQAPSPPGAAKRSAPGAAVGRPSDLSRPEGQVGGRRRGWFMA
jgi:hypothetical protein